MWVVKDELDKLYINLKKIDSFPTLCPLCQKKNVHIHMHIHNNETRKGALWIWCSNCFAYIHGSIYVPDYWECNKMLKNEPLYAVPFNLDEKKTEIDSHANKILQNINHKNIS